MLGASNCGESTRMPHAVMAIPAVPSSWTGRGTKTCRTSVGAVLTSCKRLPSLSKLRHFAQLQEEAEEEEEDLPWSLAEKSSQREILGHVRSPQGSTAPGTLEASGACHGLNAESAPDRVSLFLQTRKEAFCRTM